MTDIWHRLDSKILSISQFNEWRRKDGISKVVVHTNGVFDILHRGHITYLTEAAALGDVLVVSVNADETVKKLKGPMRPVHRQQDRMIVLASLFFVRFVIPFSEMTPVRIINEIRPNIHVKGGDYKVDDLPESKTVLQYGGEIRILPYLAGYSTTAAIEKITVRSPANE